MKVFGILLKVVFCFSTMKPVPPQIGWCNSFVAVQEAIERHIKENVLGSSDDRRQNGPQKHPKRIDVPRLDILPDIKCLVRWNGEDARTDLVAAEVAEDNTWFDKKKV